jgi:hypothetical protein
MYIDKVHCVKSSSRYNLINAEILQINKLLDSCILWKVTKSFFTGLEFQHVCTFRSPDWQLSQRSASLRIFTMKVKKIWKFFLIFQVVSAVMGFGTFKQSDVLRN